MPERVGGAAGASRAVALWCGRGASGVPELARALDELGCERVVLTSPDDVAATSKRYDLVGAVLWLGDDEPGAWAVVEALREAPATPVRTVVVATEAQLARLAARRGTFDDFCCEPWSVDELVVRLALTSAAPDEVVSYGPLRINPDTYEAVIDDRPLDLTYMQYRLLHHLASHPGRVFTREVLLSEVWGYEYFGGARTVDVHIRRLRAKLGEEHADLIQTVRSVGYRFGRRQWR